MLKGLCAEKQISKIRIAKSNVNKNRKIPQLCLMT